MAMAAWLQVSQQAAQSMQSSAPTTAIASTIVIEFVGHAPTQSPHPSHFSLSTTAGMGPLPGYDRSPYDPIHYIG
jgi:hypothetical protein